MHRDIASTLPTGVGVRGYEDADDIILRNRPRTQTRQRRSQTITFVPQMGPEYKFIEKYNIVSVAGKLFLPSSSNFPLDLSLSLSIQLWATWGVYFHIWLVTSRNQLLSVCLCLSLPLLASLLEMLTQYLHCHWGGCHVRYVCCSLVNICAMFHTNSLVHCSSLPQLCKHVWLRGIWERVLLNKQEMYTTWALMEQSVCWLTLRVGQKNQAKNSKKSIALCPHSACVPLPRL